MVRAYTPFSLLLEDAGVTGTSIEARHPVRLACRQLLSQNKGSWGNTDNCLRALLWFAYLL